MINFISQHAEKGSQPQEASGETARDIEKALKEKSSKQNAEKDAEPNTASEDAAMGREEAPKKKRRKK